MTHEDYVSFEQAQKLKELGFDWECKASYHDLSGFKESVYAHNFNRSKRYSDCICSAPTLAQAQKWLREVKEIIICIEPRFLTRKRLFVGYDCHLVNKDDGVVCHIESETISDTYEQALSAGIDKALGIIKEQEDGNKS